MPNYLFVFLDELMTQLKMYEAEAKNLRSVVTDLSGGMFFKLPCLYLCL